MNNNLTEMIFILDMSGSMSNLREDTIGGYNTLLDEQRKQDGDANVTTVLFDHEYILLHDRKPIQEVKNLTTEDYCPRGMTAMLDAVGITINSIGQKLANMSEDERPGNVVVTIITDGMENASKEYTWSQVQSMIKEQREKYSWIFTFIGANIDTQKVSESMGIDARFAKNYTASKAGTNSIYKSMSSVMSYTRTSKIDKADITTEEMAMDISALMDDIE